MSVLVAFEDDKPCAPPAMVGDRALARGTSVALFASRGLAIHKSITPEA